MAKSKRVLFTFDSRSYANLKELTEQGAFASMADTVRDSLQTTRALHSQAKHGFTELVLRNPDTKQERVVIIPSLQSISEH